MRTCFSVAFEALRGGAGKTTLVANLGVLMASRFAREQARRVRPSTGKPMRKVLVVDLEMDAPGIEECLWTPNDAAECRGMLGLIDDYPRSMDIKDAASIHHQPERYIHTVKRIPHLDVLPVGFLIGEERHRARGKLYKLLEADQEAAPLSATVREAVPFIARLHSFLNANYELVLLDSKSGMSATNFKFVLGLADFLVTMVRPFSGDSNTLQALVRRFVAENRARVGGERAVEIERSSPCLIAVSPRPSSTSPLMTEFFDRLAEVFPFAPVDGESSGMHYAEFPYDAFLQAGGVRILFNADGTPVDPMSPLGCAYEDLAELIAGEMRRHREPGKKRATDKTRK